MQNVRMFLGSWQLAGGMFVGVWSCLLVRFILIACQRIFNDPTFIFTAAAAFGVTVGQASATSPVVSFLRSIRGTACLTHIGLGGITVYVSEWSLRNSSRIAARTAIVADNTGAMCSTVTYLLGSSESPVSCDHA